MTDYAKTSAELADQLWEQVEFLARSGVAFDDGYEGEAKRLATTIRILVHDTRLSTSLLEHLRVKTRLLYMDTVVPLDPANLSQTPGLLRMRLSTATGASWRAPLGDLSAERQNPPAVFASWWGDPIMKDEAGNVFRRSDFVLTVANKEGGAHVDPKIPAAYAELTRKNTLGFVYVLGDEQPAPLVGDVALTSVRQIAYELEQTLRDQLPALGLGQTTTSA